MKILAEGIHRIPEPAFCTNSNNLGGFPMEMSAMGIRLHVDAYVDG